MSGRSWRRVCFGGMCVKRVCLGGPGGQHVGEVSMSVK